MICFPFNVPCKLDADSEISIFTDKQSCFFQECFLNGCIYFSCFFMATSESMTILTIKTACTLAQAKKCLRK